MSSCSGIAGDDWKPDPFDSGTGTLACVGFAVAGEKKIAQARVPLPRKTVKR